MNGIRLAPAPQPQPQPQASESSKAPAQSTKKSAPARGKPAWANDATIRSIVVGEMDPDLLVRLQKRREQRELREQQEREREERERLRVQASSSSYGFGPLIDVGQDVERVTYYGDTNWKDATSIPSLLD
ncbi:hypothetical protein PG999_014386 [Apiospora kogelbergensis]|uniref:Uncharacterized protein n=1 Tax=Apiospora kogelbergensis TaxID=1337665 RepID=A0AAW0Q4R7_9PEZI